MIADFLLEIGVEEIPATVVLAALEQLKGGLENALQRGRLAHGAVEVYGTARRLTALVRDVAEQQDDAVTEHKGPPASQAFDAEGRPTKAAIGFARARGVPVEELEVKETERGEFVFARVVEPGRPAREVLAEIVPQVVSNLTFPKTMRWGTGEFRFCRPVRWVVALLGGEVVPLEIAGLKAGRATRGHRIYGASQLELSSPDEYLARLEEQYVVVDHRRRRDMIAAMVQQAAARTGGRARVSDSLLDEVAFMVEYPTPVVGRFHQRFLELPEAVVVKVLEGHQRFFAVEDAGGRLMPYFVGVRDGTDEGLDNVVRGYEWVVEPRLEDAEFYLREDLKTPFAERAELLKRMTFVAGAGTLYDKAQRLAGLVEWLGERVGASQPDVACALRAAHLCKCDLTTMMIGDTKLGELQGIIGAEYARRSDEPEPVATAIEEHYRPRGAGDAPPQTPAGRLLATADRIDTLVACYAVGMRPTGSQDPYALRRQMQGLIAIAVDGGLRYPWTEAVRTAYALVAADADAAIQDEAEVAAALAGLAQQRLEAALQEEGVRYDLARAVNSSGWRDFVEGWERARLLMAKADVDPEWEHVVLSGQRIANIYRPARDKAAEGVDLELLSEDEERRLYEAAQAADGRMRAAVEQGRWEELWDVVVGLAPIIDSFFDEVLVMAEDEKVRANRLALLGQVERVLFRLADMREVVLS